MRPVKHALLFSCCFLLACTTTGESPTIRQLFNGNNLDGWHIINNGQFSVSDGTLKLNRGTGWLRSDDVFDDFLLRIEFRFLEDGANSGIFVRTGPSSADDDNGWPNDGYQIQCMDTLSGTPLGPMIPYGAPPFASTSDMEALTRAYKPAGEWHLYEIEAAGTTLNVLINGELVTKATRIENLTGHVGIQGELGLLEFRKIEIEQR